MNESLRDVIYRIEPEELPHPLRAMAVLRELAREIPEIRAWLEREGWLDDPG